MMTKDVTINIETGLEARPVAQLVEVANQFDSKIYLEVEDKKVNAKSIMGMMSLGRSAGEKVVIAAEGEDEEQAIESIENYLNNTEV